MANTVGEKELKTSWDETTASDETKRVGHRQDLEAEQNVLMKNDLVGL